MRVSTYNMLGFQGWPEDVAAKELGPAGSEKRLTHFTKVLGELDFDILGVQEGLSVDWLEQVAASIGVQAAAFPSPGKWPGAVFSRYPILEYQDFSGDEVPAGTAFSRTAGAALLDVDGKRLWVVNIHTHPKDQALRDAEAEILGSKVDELLPTEPNVIVLGDFNSPIGTVVHEALRNRDFANTMDLAGQGDRHTMTDRNGNGRLIIDHIYVSPALVGAVKLSRVFSEPGFRLPKEPGPDVWVHSDHLPVVADLEW